MVEEIKEIKKKVNRKLERSGLTFLVFLALSTLFWLLIKLSENYTTSTTYRLTLVESPADKWISSPEQSVKLSLNIDGFHTLRYNLIREQNRVVEVPLSEVPYRQESGNVYSFSSQYVAEKIAGRIGIEASDITMNDALVYFNIEPLMSKVVPVELTSDIKTHRQYEVYGLPVLSPSSVTIYGPTEMLDTLRSIKTVLLSASDVSETIEQEVALDLHEGSIHSNATAVKVKVEVVQYTEVDIKVPVSGPDTLKVHFFPEAMTVKCKVPIKDYASIGPESFVVRVNGSQLKQMSPLLDVQLVSWPRNVQIVSASPDKVEYMIVR